MENDTSVLSFKSSPVKYTFDPALTGLGKMEGVFLTFMLVND
jgi:hypothetical protein